FRNVKRLELGNDTTQNGVCRYYDFTFSGSNRSRQKTLHCISGEHRLFIYRRRQLNVQVQAGGKPWIQSRLLRPPIVVMRRVESQLRLGFEFATVGILTAGDGVEVSIVIYMQLKRSRDECRQARDFGHLVMYFAVRRADIQAERDSTGGHSEPDNVESTRIG